MSKKQRSNAIRIMFFPGNEITRHIDSILGMTLAIVTFETNTIASTLPQELLNLRLGYPTLLVLSILPGVIGILSEFWPAKIYSWTMTMYLLLSEFSILAMVRVTAQGIYVSQRNMYLLLGPLPILLAALILWHIIRQAYLRGLSVAEDSVALRSEIEGECRFLSVVGVLYGIICALWSVSTGTV